MPRSAAAVEKFFQLSLLGLVASGFLAVAGSGYLDVSTTLLMAAGLVLRGAMAAGLLKIECLNVISSQSNKPANREPLCQPTRDSSQRYNS